MSALNAGTRAKVTYSDPLGELPGELNYFWFNAEHSRYKCCCSRVKVTQGTLAHALAECAMIFSGIVWAAVQLMGFEAAQGDHQLLLPVFICCFSSVKFILVMLLVVGIRYKLPKLMLPYIVLKILWITTMLCVALMCVIAMTSDRTLIYRAFGDGNLDALNKATAAAAASGRDNGYGRFDDDGGIDGIPAIYTSGYYIGLIGIVLLGGAAIEIWMSSVVISTYIYIKNKLRVRQLYAEHCSDCRAILDNRHGRIVRFVPI